MVASDVVRLLRRSLLAPACRDRRRVWLGQPQRIVTSPGDV